MLPGYVLRAGEAFLCIFKLSSKLPNTIKERNIENAIIERSSLNSVFYFFIFSD